MFDEREAERHCTVTGDTITLRLPKAQEPLRPDFDTVVADIKRTKFTGRFSVDCQSGVLLVVEFPQEPMRIRLDTERRKARN